MARRRNLNLLTSLVFAGLATSLVAGCGSSHKSTASANPRVSPPSVSSTAPADTAAATAAIKANWALAFDGSSKDPKRVTLLEDYQQLAAAIAFNANPAKDMLISSRVTAVTFTSNTTADVVFDVLSRGAVILPAAKGQVVLQDGTWKVSKASFCALKALGAPGKTVPGCA